MQITVFQNVLLEAKEKEIFYASWFDTWLWLNYQEASDSVICFYCYQASNRNLLMKGRAKKLLSQRVSSIGRMLTRASENMKLQNFT